MEREEERDIKGGKEEVGRDIKLKEDKEKRVLKEDKQEEEKDITRGGEGY